MTYDPRYQLVPLRVGLNIADTREPKGKFVCNYRGDGVQVYEAIDNTDKELRTKKFNSYADAIEWLKGDNDGDDIKN